MNHFLTLDDRNSKLCAKGVEDEDELASLVQSLLRHFTYTDESIIHEKSSAAGLHGDVESEN